MTCLSLLAPRAYYQPLDTLIKLLAKGTRNPEQQLAGFTLSKILFSCVAIIRVVTILPLLSSQAFVVL